ncbi:hypothetical protein EON77_09880, partial [bacterium]
MNRREASIRPLVNEVRTPGVPRHWKRSMRVVPRVTMQGLGLVAGAAATMAACSVAGRAGSTPPQGAPAATQGAAGGASQRGGTATNVTKFYNETCAGCHGAEGQGGGAGTRTLNTRELFDQRHDLDFFNAIKNGVPDMAMPAYGATLSDEEIWAQVVHVRELQARALRAEEGSPKPDAGGVYRSKLAGFKVEDVTSNGLRTPWSLDFLPDGRMFVTNRAGTLHIVAKDGTLGSAIADTPK